MWKRRGGDYWVDLGHGLELRVWYEAVERLPHGAPAWCASALGRRLVSRSETAAGARRRAEVAARRWMAEAALKLSGVI